MHSFYYVIMQGGGDWRTDRSVQIVLDPSVNYPAKYPESAIFMLVRCVESRAEVCAFMEFNLEGFGRFSHCAPDSGSSSVREVHFSDVWAYVQNPRMLWKSASVAPGLSLSEYRHRADPDERPACSRLCHELFGRHPGKNSGKVVTKKFVPWVARMFEEAVSVVATAKGGGDGGDGSHPEPPNQQVAFVPCASRDSSIYHRWLVISRSCPN